jgi:archaellum component FlaF (FlaF/FlaG flagellin family)
MTATDPSPCVYIVVVLASSSTVYIPLTENGASIEHSHKNHTRQNGIIFSENHALHAQLYLHRQLINSGQELAILSLSLSCISYHPFALN